ncbi:MAG TPA: transcriptional regulator, partial [Kiritimatiellia bacterium]|nr:transcriptional regulator [Kiritimatiellia bacterium]
RESLYKALSKDGNPELSTILRVFDSVGLKLKAVPG